MIRCDDNALLTLSKDADDQPESGFVIELKVITTLLFSWVVKRQS